MKWSKRNELGMGALGQGYKSGEYIIEETYLKDEMLKGDWVLRKNGEAIKFGKTAKSLKQFAETL